LSLHAKVIVFMLIRVLVASMFGSALHFLFQSKRKCMLIQCRCKARLIDIERDFLHRSMIVIRPIDCAIDSLQFNHKLRVKFLHS
jgi:hypothetical protein